jgi:hypothetical protein
VRERERVTDRVIVVGAGAAGLGAAIELARTRPVRVVDRIPVAGGVAGFEHPHVASLLDAASRAGVRFELGATATRWHGGRLLVCAPGAIRWLTADALVFAGGERPATAAELGLVGERPAGVLPITVAKHLLETGVALWRHAVILGDRLGANATAALVRHTGGRVTYVGDAGSCPDWADRSRSGWRAATVLGTDHVRAVEIVRGDERERIDCDALLLAVDPRPVRNVEGAIADDAEGVLFLQGLPGDDVSRVADEAAREARTIAAGWAVAS